MMQGGYGGNSLVGPGAMTQYEGRPGRQRTSGYVRVSKHPDGFFVAGSSLEGINGLYGQVKSIPKRMADLHEFQLAYKHDQTGWYMAMVDAPKGSYMEADAEWLFIDPSGRDRFSHIGDTIVPGSGKRWKFVHRGQPRPKHGGDSTTDTSEEDEQQMVERGDEDEDQLPWQLIAILSADMLQKLRRHYRYYDYECRAARSGHGLPEIEAGPYASMVEEPPQSLLDANACWEPAIEARAAFEAGRWAKAQAAYESIVDGLETEKDGTSTESWRDDEATKTGKWRRAFFSLQLASCMRRARSDPSNSKAAKKYARRALKIFPCYKAALFELGMIMMDWGDGHYGDAVKSFERVLRLQRDYPSVDRWLLRAHAHLRREALQARIQAWKSKMLALEDKDAEREKERKKQEKKRVKRIKRQQQRRVERRAAKRVKKEAARALKREQKLKKKKEEAALKAAKARKMALEAAATSGGGATPPVPPSNEECKEKNGDDTDDFHSAESSEERIVGESDSDEAFSTSSVSSNMEESTEDDPDEEVSTDPPTEEEDEDGDGEDGDDDETGVGEEKASKAKGKSKSIDDIDDDDEGISDIDMDLDEGSGSGSKNPVAHKNPEPLDDRFSSTNHYVVMGVPSDFTADDLKKAYRRISRTVHPDKRGWQHGGVPARR